MCRQRYAYNSELWINDFMDALLLVSGTDLWLNNLTQSFFMPEELTAVEWMNIVNQSST